MSDHNSDKNRKRAMQIKRHRERSKSSVELPMNEEKLRLLEKKQYAESIDHTHNSFLEHAINLTTSVIINKANSYKEDTELVISDLDANVDENDEESSTPSIPKSSSSGSNSFIPMKNNLQKNNLIKQNQENVTPSYLLLMQYFEGSQDKESQGKCSKNSSNPNLPTQIVYIINLTINYRLITIL
jgi:hypothetical protein